MTVRIEQTWDAAVANYDEKFSASGDSYTKGVDLTNTASEGVTVNSAIMYDTKIIVDVEDLAETEKITITVPRAIKIVGACIVSIDGLSTRTIQVLNNTTAITDLMASGATTTGDGDITYASNLDMSEASFAKDDADLVIEAATGTGDWDGLIIIDYVLV